MKKEIKNATILEKTVRRENGKILKRVQDDMFVQDDKFGFTLAEVLITLGIIGVVAAMTMPSLIQKYQEKATVTQLKKANSVLNQAYQRAMAEYGPASDWFSVASSSSKDENGEWPEANIINAKLLWERLSKYMKTVSVCYASDKSCKIPVIVYLHQQSRGNTTASGTVVKLADGISFYGGWIGYPNCTLNTHCGDFQVDINGDKKPNVFGKDVFDFLITPKGIFPNGTQTLSGRQFPQECSRKSTSGANGYACAAWVIYNENMDYLHCDDLSWDGKHKCSD